jgi:hypothetical protein
MFLLLSLFVASVFGGASFCTRINQKGIGGGSKIALGGVPVAKMSEYVKTECIRSDWLKMLYDGTPEERAKYTAWVRKVSICFSLRCRCFSRLSHQEQSKLGLSEILAHAGLLKCFRTFMSAPTIGTEGLDMLIDVNKYASVPTEAVRWQKGCEIWHKYVKNGAPNNVNFDGSQAGKKVITHIAAVFSACTPSAPPADTSRATPTFFASAVGNLMSEVLLSQVPPFHNTDIFVNCKGSSVLEEEISSFSAILNSFCEDEKKSYKVRC